jgi:hypothetical protein
MNPLGIAILLVLNAAVLFAPRKWALLAMLGGVLFLTQHQAVVVFGFNLFTFRFLELAAFIRVIARREFSFSDLKGIDRSMLWLYAFTTMVFLLRSKEGKMYQIGNTVDALLAYFAFRGLITTVEDFYFFLRAFVLLLIPYTAIVMFQSYTNHNLFTLLGAQDGISGLRKGRPRCDASFRQPDLLGMFAASFIPLYIAMVCHGRNRKAGFVAIALCCLIAWAANSGGALAAAAVAFFGWAFWIVRKEMWKVRRGMVVGLILLALVMKAPVWFIFDRVSNITGGDGYHRSVLIDAAVRDLGKWWLAGMSFHETSGWFAYTLSSGVADITNQYVGFGIQAGVGSIALFILLFRRAFGNIGTALATVWSAPEPANGADYLLWSLGVTLVVHLVDWFGITYFDQMYLVWSMQIGAIATLSQTQLAGKEHLLAVDTVTEPSPIDPAIQIGASHKFTVP